MTQYISLLDFTNIVQVNEEFGFRQWLWSPEFSVENLTNWWKSVSTVNKRNMKQLLKGQLWCVEDCSEYYDKALAKYRLFDNGYYHLHVCCDKDSFLYDLQGNKIYHLGYIKEINETAGY